MTYFICRVPFGTSELKIKTLKEIDNSFAEEISFFVNQVFTELNPDIINTSAHKFNHAQTGIPIFLKHEFIEFLMQHLELVGATDYKYQPFDINPAFEDSLLNYIVVDKSSLSIVKKQDFSLPKNIIRKNFVVDALSNLLNEKGINDFLINTDGIFLARGNHSWEVDIGRQLKDGFVLEIKNESVVFEPVDDFVGEQGFGIKNESLPIEYVFVQGKFTTLPKIITDIAKQSPTQGNLRLLSSKFNLTIHSLDGEENFTTYAPN